MEKMGLLTMNCLFIFIFWGVSIWMFSNRSRPVKINSVFPIVVKYRKGRLHPLYGDRSDILWFALFMFLLGCLFFASLILNLFG